MTTTRFRSGLVQLARFRVSASTVIEPGDLLYLNGNLVHPAGDFTWLTDLATTRAAFAAAFVGIAHTGSADGNTELVSADISPLAVYEAATIPSEFSVGHLLAPSETLLALASQTLDQVFDPAQAIARSVEPTGSASPTIRVNFASSIHAGSANVNAALG